MKNWAENGIDSFKQASKNAVPWVLTASLTTHALLYPRIATAQTQKPKAPVQIPSEPTIVRHNIAPEEVVDVRPQCGGINYSTSETVMVVVGMREQELLSNEYLVGKKPGECGNSPVRVSSLYGEQINLSQISKPDVLSRQSINVDCNDWATGFVVEEVGDKITGIDVTPSKGKLESGRVPDVRLNIHTDLLTERTYSPSYQVYCVSPEGIEIKTPYIVNYGISLKP